MGGELRVDHVGGIQQGTGAGQVGHVGVRLVGEDRVVRQAQGLRAFDFGVPVRALDQAHHEAQAVLARQGDDEIHHVQRTRLVGLHGQA